MLVQARPPSALYYAVPGDLCDRSVSVCSWIPASNNHSDPFPRRLPSLVQLPASQSSRTSWLGRKTARRVPEENRSRGDATTRSALRDFVACVEAARGAGGERSSTTLQQRQIEINFTRITRRTTFRFARFLLSSRRLYCLFSPADPAHSFPWVVSVEVVGRESRGRGLVRRNKAAK